MPGELLNGEPHFYLTAASRSSFSNMAAKIKTEDGISDLDSLAVQFGQSMMESDLKAYNGNDSGDNMGDDEDGSTSTCSALETGQKKGDASLYHGGQDMYAIITESGQKIFKCDDCGLTYNKPSSFSNHRLAHHPSVCPHCGRRFSMQSSLESHLQLVCERKENAPEEKFECHICHKKVACKKSLQSHMRQHTGAGQFNCSVCPKTFNMQSSLDFHMKSHDLQKPFRCKLCMSTFTEKSTVVRHLKKIHNKTQNKTGDLNEFIENNLVPESPVELAQQLGQVPGLKSIPEARPVDPGPAKPHATPSLKSLLEQPLATFNPIASSLLMNAANMQRMAQQAAAAQMNIKQEAPSPGPDSDSDEDEMGLLSPDSIHGLVTDALNKIPGMNRSYQCKLCNKTYYHSSSLNKHMKKHNVGDTFQCNVCRKRCVSKSDLASHMQTHKSGSVGSFPCPICGAVCARKSSTLRHIRQAHGFSIDHAKEIMKMDQTDKLASHDTSDMDTNDDSNSGADVKPEPPAERFAAYKHLTCTICEQIFTEKSHLKDHYDIVHNVDPERAFNDLKPPEITKWSEPVSLLGTKHHQNTDPMSFGNDSLLDTTLSVVVEKDNNGVQKVIRVMPERGSKLPSYLQSYDDVPSRRKQVPVQDTTEATPVKPYKCNLCDTRFVEKSSVRRHLKRSHNYSVEEAKEYSFDNLKPNQEQDTSEDMFGDESMDTFGELTEKEKQEDSEDMQTKRIYRCSLCPKKFMIRSSVRRHLRKIHNFSLDEARECDIVAEESTDIRTRRSSADVKANKPGNTKTKSTKKCTSPGKGKEELSCRFCTLKFNQRIALKRHLFTVHELDSQDADLIIENQTKEPKQCCPLCFTEFDSSQTVKTHLVKLHRVSDAVADRLLSKQAMCDYTEGIQDPDDDSTSMSITDESPYNYVLGQMPPTLPKENVMFFDKDQDEKSGFDVDTQAEVAKPEENEVLFSLKANKELLLADLNFEAINPWGSTDKGDGFNVDLDVMAGESGLDYKLEGNEKLIDNIGNLDSETNKAAQDEDRGGSSTQTSSLDKAPFTSSYNRKMLRYDCPICGKVLGDASARSKHIRRHEGTAGFQCGICNRIYLQLRMIESHLKTHGGFGVKCGLCFIYCAEKNGAKRHLIRLHSMKNKNKLLEPLIHKCSLDTDNIDELQTNYNVINLSEEEDIISVIPEVMMGYREDVEKWERERKLLKINEDTVEEKDEQKTSKTVKQEMEDNEDTAYESNDNTTEPFEKRPGTPKAKLDSVVDILHKKLMNKMSTNSENDDQCVDETEMESASNTDSPQPEYCAETTSPLKLKFTFKKVRREEDTGKSEENDDQKIENDEETNDADNEEDENGADTDQTEDLEFDAAATAVAAATLDAAMSSRGEVMEAVDREILTAIMPHLQQDNSALDAISATLKALQQKPPKSKKPEPHLVCWECGKAYR